MFRNEKETGEDIRLSTRLFNKCLPDYQKFCKDIEPGMMRVQECLEDNVDESGFSSDCKSELENVLAKRVSDFRMDTALRDACESELKDTCGSTLEDMDSDDKIKKSALNCLQQFKDELKSDKCKAEVHRRMQRASRDVRFDEVLATACFEDRTKYCVDVQPVSGPL
jgi:Golgi apparatus protein 1